MKSALRVLVRSDDVKRAFPAVVWSILIAIVVVFAPIPRSLTLSVAWLCLGATFFYLVGSALSRNAPDDQRHTYPMLTSIASVVAILGLWRVYWGKPTDWYAGFWFVGAGYFYYFVGPIASHWTAYIIRLIVRDLVRWGQEAK